jgi:hypothetical protein
MNGLLHETLTSAFQSDSISAILLEFEITRISTVSLPIARTNSLSPRGIFQK